MKRVLLIGGIGVGVLSVLAVAVIFALAVSPVRAQISQAVNAAFHGGIAPAVQAFAAQPQTQLKEEKGILVAGVYSGSPADQAGLQRGDIILDVDGKVVNTRAELNSVLATHKAGDTLKLSVQRGDAATSASVTLAELPAASGNANPQRQPALKVFLGIVPLGAGEEYGKNMPGGMGMLPGAQTVMGATITQVAAGSPAEKAGLAVGDILISVDGAAMDAQHSLATLLAAHKPGDSVKLVVQNSSSAQNEVTVTLGENPQKQGAAWLGVAVNAGRMRGDWQMLPGMPGVPQDGTLMPHGHMFPGFVNHPGALVEQVTAGSPAEKAGLKAGSLIQAVDGKQIDTPQVLTDAITQHKPGDSVTLTVFDPQAGKSNDVQVTLGDNPQKAGSAWLGIQYTYIDMQPNPQQTPQPDNNNGTQF